MGNRYAILAPPSSIDANRDGQVSAGELAIVAAWGGAFVFAVFLGLMGIIGALTWSGPGWLRLLLLAVSLGLVVGSAIGAWRMLYAVFEHGLRWKAQDRQRAIEAEEYERGRMEGLEDKAGDRISQVAIDNTARLMLLNYYAGKPWQRGSIKGVSDVKWNLANEALQKAGLRRGRTNRVEAESMAEAWAKYIEWRMSAHTFKVGDDRDLIAN